MKRKIFAALLAVMMVVSMLPLSVMAVEDAAPVTRKVLVHVGAEPTPAVEIEVPADGSTKYFKYSDFEKYAVRTGYTFNGWYQVSWELDGASRVDQKPENSKYFSEDRYLYIGKNYKYVVLYADMVPTEYTLTFVNSNGKQRGNVITGLVMGQEVDLSDLLKEAGYAPNPDRYILTGFKYDGIKCTLDNDTYTMPARDVVITIRDDYAPLELIYDANGGAFADGTTEKVEVVKYSKTIPAFEEVPVKKGYTFLGWEGLTEKMPEGGLTVKAQWELTDYALTIYTTSFGERVNLWTSGKVLHMGDKVTLADKIEIPTGYMIDEWEAAAADGTYTMPASNAAIKVTFKPINYTIALSPAGGTVENKTISATYDAEVKLPVPTKTGYTFLGWMDATGNFVESPAKNLADTEGAVVELKAKWDRHDYTVALDPNGGTVEVTSIGAKYGDDISLPTPVRTGYSFNGWSDGNNTYVGTAPCLTAADGVTVTLTAQWTANKYTVTFDANGGSVSPKSKTVTFDQKYGKLPVPGMMSNDFTGWYLDGVLVTADTIVKTPGDHTLIASWDGMAPEKSEVEYEPRFEVGLPKNLRSIVIDTTEGGKTGVGSGKAVAAFGSTYRLTVTPDEGYEIDEVLVNGKEVKVSKDNKVRFVVKANTHVEVSFVEIED